MKGGSGRLVAGSFGLLAFTVAIVSGLAAGNPAVTILLRALLAMAICYPLGLAVGLLCQKVVFDAQASTSRPLEPSTDGIHVAQPEAPSRAEPPAPAAPRGPAVESRRPAPASPG